MWNSDITKRYRDCAWFKPLDISVVGLGGVGRGTAQTLFLAGHRLHVWDGDTVEEVNVAVQGYQSKYIGWSKPDAFRYQMAEFTGDTSTITVTCHNWESRNSLKSVVIAAADDWVTLENLYYDWRDNRGELFISPGMLADMYSIKVYMKDDGLDWKSGSDTESVPCTTKSSMYMANLIHGRIASIVNKFIIQPDLIDHEYYFNGILD